MTATSPARLASTSTPIACSTTVAACTMAVIVGDMARLLDETPASLSCRPIPGLDPAQTFAQRSHPVRGRRNDAGRRLCHHPTNRRRTLTVGRKSGARFALPPAAEGAAPGSRRGQGFSVLRPAPNRIHSNNQEEHRNVGQQRGPRLPRRHQGRRFHPVRGRAVLHRGARLARRRGGEDRKPRRPAIPAAGCGPASRTTIRITSTCSTPTRSRSR